jgi:hypothetical protein
VVLTGTGLVVFVTRPVKSVTLPITLLEKSWTPRTIEAAKSEPGSCGSAGPAPPPVGMEGVEVGIDVVPLPQVGS